MSKKSRAFTLIELLVVIAIIAILTAIVTTNLAQSKSKARDAKRVSDIAQIQLALELAFDRCKTYPPSSGSQKILSAGTIVCAGYTVADFISVIPKDPNGSDYLYNPTTNFYDYLLKATMENYNSALSDDIDDLSSTLQSAFGVSANYCGNSSGNNDREYCVRPK